MWKALKSVICQKELKPSLFVLLCSSTHVEESKGVQHLIEAFEEVSQDKNMPPTRSLGLRMTDTGPQEILDQGCSKNGGDIGVLLSIS